MIYSLISYVPCAYLHCACS